MLLAYTGCVVLLFLYPVAAWSTAANGGFTAWWVWLMALESVCGPLPYERGLRVLILCDLDQLQQLNARYGRTVSDDALRYFTRILQANVREGDHLGRLGNEESVIALRHIDLPRARALATRIHEELARALGTKNALRAGNSQLWRCGYSGQGQLRHSTAPCGRTALSGKRCRR